MPDVLGAIPGQDLTAKKPKAAQPKGLKLSDLAAKSLPTKTDVILIGDDDAPMELSVTWRPGAYTKAFEQTIRDAIDDRRFGASSVASIQLLIVEWSLLEDDGAFVPITEERLSEIPVALLSQIINALGKEQSPPEAKSTRFGIS